MASNSSSVGSGPSESPSYGASVGAAPRAMPRNFNDNSNNRGNQEHQTYYNDNNDGINPTPKTEKERIMEALNAYGNYSADDFKFNTVQGLDANVPADNIWESTKNNFFQRINAVSEDEKKSCLILLIANFLVNGTSPETNRNEPISWPTGAYVSINDSWRVPDSFTLRAFLHHHEAQNVANMILCHDMNIAKLLKNKQDSRFRKCSIYVMPDFVYLPNNPIADGHSADYERIKNSKVQSSRTTSTPQRYENDAPSRDSSDNYFADPYTR